MEEMLAKMVCLLMCVWFIAWTPYAAMSVWIMFFEARGLTPVMGIVPTLCCKVSAGSNAMLYGLRLVFNVNEVIETKTYFVFIYTIIFHFCVCKLNSCTSFSVYLSSKKKFDVWFTQHYHHLSPKVYA